MAVASITADGEMVREMVAKWCQEPFLGRPLFRTVFFNP
jgi:hypothetical protein